MTHPKVPFFRPLIGDAEINNVIECMRSGWLTTGPMTAAFESEFSERMDGAECLAVTSATAALHLGLEALGVGAGPCPPIIKASSSAQPAQISRRLVFMPIKQ